MAVVVVGAVVVIGVVITVALLVGLVAIGWAQAMDRASAERAPGLASTVELPCSPEQVEAAVARRTLRRTPVEV